MNIRRNNLTSEELSVIEIHPLHGYGQVDLHELWVYRELLYFFIWRDIKIRYKQTVLGAAWAIVQPFFMMVVFTLFFGKLAEIPSEGVPYPLFSYAALLPWTFFADGLTRSTNSMVGNSSILTKVYLPRMIMPLSGVVSPLIDFFISFIVFICMMYYFGYYPTIRIIILPLLLALAMGTALGVGLWSSILNAKYRDIGYVVPFLIQLWLYASPVVYPSSLVPEPYLAIYSLNPMVGVIEGFRWALLGTNPPSSLIYVSILVVFLMLISGALYFSHAEKIFSDVV
jgi:lipopolysaccharide transport system permease protein